MRKLRRSEVSPYPRAFGNKDMEKRLGIFENSLIKRAYEALSKAETFRQRVTRRS